MKEKEIKIKYKRDEEKELRNIANLCNTKKKLLISVILMNNMFKQGHPRLMVRNPSEIGFFLRNPSEMTFLRKKCKR